MSQRGRPSKARLAVVLFAAGTAVFAVVGVQPPETAGAADAAPFTATAVAQGMRVTLVVPRFLVAETLADGGAPVSQAQLTSLGGRAFASSLFPGDTATFQQAAAALGLPPLPAYPAQVSATHPTEPKAEAAPAGQSMSAEAGFDRAAGRAIAGGPPPAGDGQTAAARSLSATTAEAAPDGSVVARAETVVEGAVFPGGLRIGRVGSVVTATLAPGAATPVVESLTTVTGAEVAGTAVEIGPDGITSPQAVGLPAGAAQPVDEALRQAGTSVRRVRGEPLAGGGSSDAIEVRSTLAPAPGVPEATVIYRLGGAAATVVRASLSSGDLLPPPDFAGGVPSEVPGPAPESLGASGPASSPVGLATPSPLSAPRSGAGAAFAVPYAGRPPDAPPPAPTTSGATTEQPLVAPDQLAASPLDRVRLAVDLRDELGWLYLALILGGLAAFAAASALRRKGVQHRWSS